MLPYTILKVGRESTIRLQVRLWILKGEKGLFLHRPLPIVTAVVLY